MQYKFIKTQEEIEDNEPLVYNYFEGYDQNNKYKSRKGFFNRSLENKMKSIEASKQNEIKSMEQLENKVNTYLLCLSFLEEAEKEKIKEEVLILFHHFKKRSQMDDEMRLSVIIKGICYERLKERVNSLDLYVNIGKFKKILNISNKEYLKFRYICNKLEVRLKKHKNDKDNLCDCVDDDEEGKFNLESDQFLFNVDRLINNKSLEENKIFNEKEGESKENSQNHMKTQENDMEKLRFLRKSIEFNKKVLFLLESKGLYHEIREYNNKTEEIISKSIKFNTNHKQILLKTRLEIERDLNVFISLIFNRNIVRSLVEEYSLNDNKNICFICVVLKEFYKKEYNFNIKSNILNENFGIVSSSFSKMSSYFRKEVLCFK